MWGSTLFLHQLYPENGPVGESCGSGPPESHMQTKKCKVTVFGLRVEAGHPACGVRIMGLFFSFCFVFVSTYYVVGMSLKYCPHLILTTSL